MPDQRTTIQKVANAYGVSITTIHQWRKKASLTLADFLKPRHVCDRLHLSMKNASPRLVALRDKKTQLEIVFRLAVAGLASPNK